MKRITFSILAPVTEVITPFDGKFCTVKLQTEDVAVSRDSLSVGDMVAFIQNNTISRKLTEETFDSKAIDPRSNGRAIHTPQTKFNPNKFMVSADKSNMMITASPGYALDHYLHISLTGHRKDIQSHAQTSTHRMIHAYEIAPNTNIVKLYIHHSSEKNGATTSVVENTSQFILTDEELDALSASETPELYAHMHFSKGKTPIMLKPEARLIYEKWGYVMTDGFDFHAQVTCKDTQDQIEADWKIYKEHMTTDAYGALTDAIPGYTLDDLYTHDLTDADTPAPASPIKDLYPWVSFFTGEKLTGPFYSNILPMDEAELMEIQAFIRTSENHFFTDGGLTYLSLHKLHKLGFFTRLNGTDHEWILPQIKEDTPSKQMDFSALHDALNAALRHDIATCNAAHK